MAQLTAVIDISSELQKLADELSGWGPHISQAADGAWLVCLVDYDTDKIFVGPDDDRSILAVLLAARASMAAEKETK